MKTKQAALAEMKRYFKGTNTLGYLYQYMPSGSWSWAIAGSRIGEVCSASTDGTGVIRATGKPVAAIYCIEKVIV